MVLDERRDGGGSYLISGRGSSHMQPKSARQRGWRWRCDNDTNANELKRGEGGRRLRRFRSRLPLRRPSGGYSWGGWHYCAAHRRGRCSARGGSWRGCVGGASDGHIVQYQGGDGIGDGCWAVPLLSALRCTLSLLSTTPPLPPPPPSIGVSCRSNKATEPWPPSLTTQWDPALLGWILAVARKWGSTGVIELKHMEMRWLLMVVIDQFRPSILPK